jgi:hypothetical protein
LRFRAEAAGVDYSLYAAWFAAYLRAEVYLFFGVQTSDEDILRDTQKPELLAEWRKLPKKAAA